MPLLAALAVVLCTAMVLITWSVMGGFLTMLLNSGRTLIGDASISWPNTGFGHYEELIERLEQDEAIEAATPVVETFGLLSIPPTNRVETVIVKGIDGPSYARVTGFDEALWWRPMDQPLPKDRQRQDPRLDPSSRQWLEHRLEAGRSLTVHQADGRSRPALVLGLEVSGLNVRVPEGFVWPVAQLVGPRVREAKLSVLPLDPQGRSIEPVVRVFPIANEFRSGLYEVDHNVVFVRLDALQRMLNMDQAVRASSPPRADRVRIDPETGEPAGFEPMATAGPEPARVTAVLVRAAAHVPLPRLLERCRAIYARFADAHAGDPAVPPADAILIRSWEDQNATLIAAVRKEIALVLFLFTFISVTAVFLVLAIFWSMVSEKTRDIGILRALGASRAGVAWLWVRYGLAIGVVGSAVGGALAFLIVTNINPIHDWLGRTLGLVVWDPRVYYFTEIPNRMDPVKAAFVLGGGILASVLGALWPAARAARMDPVRALRFE